MFDNHIFSDTIRYEAHRLIYSPGDEDPLELTGFLGAAMLIALLVGTDEGDARGITLDRIEQHDYLFDRYEREVLRDDWGHLAAEMEQLHDNQVQMTLSQIDLLDICPNMRLASLAQELTVVYMQHLVIEHFGEHIWEYCPWQAPFSLWLWEAAHAETQRQRFLQTDWTNPAAVDALLTITNNQSPITNNRSPLTLPFPGEQAEDIMSRYLNWLSDEYVAIKREQPGAKITQADRNDILRRETKTPFSADETAEMEQMDDAQKREWNGWMSAWQQFLEQRLRPEKEVRFWTAGVSEELQEHLLYYLRKQERHPAHFRDLTTYVYAMRQLGYIRRKLSDKQMRLWLSEHLSLDYTERNNAYQFQRAMKEHGRNTLEVMEAVCLLESVGIRRFEPKPDPEEPEEDIFAVGRKPYG